MRDVARRRSFCAQMHRARRPQRLARTAIAAATPSGSSPTPLASTRASPPERRRLDRDQSLGDRSARNPRPPRAAPPPIPSRAARAAAATAGNARRPSGSAAPNWISSSPSTRQVRAGDQRIVVAAFQPAVARQHDLDRSCRDRAAPIPPAPARPRATPSTAGAAVAPAACQLAPPSKLALSAARRQPASSPAASTAIQGLPAAPSPSGRSWSRRIVGPCGRSGSLTGRPGLAVELRRRARRRAPARASPSSARASSASPARRPVSPASVTRSPGRSPARRQPSRTFAVARPAQSEASRCSASAFAAPAESAAGSASRSAARAPSPRAARCSPA